MYFYEDVKNDVKPMYGLVVHIGVTFCYESRGENDRLYNRFGKLRRIYRPCRYEYVYTWYVPHVN